VRPGAASWSLSIWSCILRCRAVNDLSKVSEKRLRSFSRGGVDVGLCGVVAVMNCAKAL